MKRKILAAVLVLSCVPLLSGCFALLAGAGGTMLWQGGKVISEETTSMARATSAVESAFKAQGITVQDKVVKNDVTQLRGEDKTNKRVAVDVFSKGPKNVRLEIRYGIGEETPARDLLNVIKKRL